MGRLVSKMGRAAHRRPFSESKEVSENNKFKVRTYRVNIPFKARLQWSGLSNGVEEDVRSCPPQCIIDETPKNKRKKMIDIWDYYFAKRLREIQRKHVGETGYEYRFMRWIFHIVLCVITCGIWFFLHMLIRCFYVLDGKKVQGYNKAIKRWQDMFTADLQKEGLPMIVKTQSDCWEEGFFSRIFENFRSYEYWIAVSLSEEDNKKLLKEPHLHGVIRKFRCGQVNEHVLVWHSPDFIL